MLDSTVTGYKVNKICMKWVWLTRYDIVRKAFQLELIKDSVFDYVPN